MNNEAIDLADCVVIQRAEIPAAWSESGYVMAGDYEAALCDDLSVDLAWRQARECIAVALFLESVAAKDKRRDELARELVSDGAYAYRFAEDPLKTAIDRIIELENLK